MEPWRQKAIEFFPELQNDLKEMDYTLYQMFFDLLPLAFESHESHHRENLRKIYLFAEWCLNQPSEAISNPAGVAFYEHLFDRDPTLWADILEWLSPDAIQQCKTLWEARLKAEKYQRIKTLIGEKRRIQI